MRSQPETRKFQRTHQVRIMPPAFDALKKRIHDAVAWRAFELYQSRGRAGEHDRDDWVQAEAQVVRPLDCGTIVEDRCVLLTTDLSCFGPGTLELWVEPRRITLCGSPAKHASERVPETAPAIGQRNWIIRTQELGAEVDPSEVTVRFNGPALLISLRRAIEKPQEAVLAQAA